VLVVEFTFVDVCMYVYVCMYPAAKDECANKGVRHETEVAYGPFSTQNQVYHLVCVCVYVFV